MSTDNTPRDLAVSLVKLVITTSAEIKSVSSLPSYFKVDNGIILIDAPLSRSTHATGFPSTCMVM